MKLTSKQEKNGRSMTASSSVTIERAKGGKVVNKRIEVTPYSSRTINLVYIWIYIVDIILMFPLLRSWMHTMILHGHFLILFSESRRDLGLLCVLPGKCTSHSASRQFCLEIRSISIGFIGLKLRCRASKSLGRGK